MVCKSGQPRCGGYTSCRRRAVDISGRRHAAPGSVHIVIEAGHTAVRRGEEQKKELTPIWYGSSACAQSGDGAADRVARGCIAMSTAADCATLSCRKVVSVSIVASESAVIRVVFCVQHDEGRGLPAAGADANGRVVPCPETTGARWLCNSV